MDLTTAAVLAGVVGLGLAGLYVWHRGIAGAAKDIGGAAVDVAGGVATGVLDGVSGAIGVPGVSDTTTDPAVSRYVIDRAGHYQASIWSGVPAYLRALTMSAGSGTPPPGGTKLAAYLATLPEPEAPIADETERLLNRYPAPAPDYSTWPTYGWGA